jgi:LCP family protein required for cell wall assembly
VPEPDPDRDPAPSTGDWPTAAGSQDWLATPVPGRGRTARFGVGVLSALLPGLGHLATGRRRHAAVFLAPVLVGIFVLGVVVATTDRFTLAASLVDPAVLWGILILEALFLVWRLVAVLSAMVDRSFPRFRLADAIGLLVVLALVVVPQAGLGLVTYTAQQADSAVFAGAPFPSEEPEPTEPPIESPSGSIVPSAAPSPSGPPTQPRVTVLLIGVDSGVGRNTALTDTMIVASLDPVAGTVSMVSIPRDLVDAPLPKGGTFSAKVNGLVAWVRWHPEQFPGYNGHGQAVLAYSLGKMLGVHIDYYAQVDLGGFVQTVNAVGGVDVNVDHAICDAGYDEYGFDGYAIGAGRHHMNGDAALAYARIRKSVGESDFTRAARQQQVVVALKDKVVRGGFIDDPIGLLTAIGRTVQTNLPPAVVRDLAPLAGQIGPKDVYKTVVGHPLVRSGFDARGSIQLPDFKKVAALGAAMFTTVGTRPPDTYVAKASSAAARGPAQPAPSCSAPAKPKPKPTPTPRPTAKPGPSPTDSPPPIPTPVPTPVPTDSPPPDPSASTGP